MKDNKADNQNSYKNNYLIYSFKKLNKTQAEIVSDLGKSQPYVSALMNGKKKVGKEIAKELSELYGFDEGSILTGVLQANEELSKDSVNDKKSGYELIPKKYNNTLEVKIVTTKARAGFSDAYYSDEYLDDLPTVLIEADREYKGKYLAFEVDGDSMEPEYNKGDIVICREIKRDLWQYKLHYKDYDFVIAHGTKGIMLKEIIDHNVETGDITCRSLNNEDGKHPDFVLNLKETAFLYNVVEHRISGKSKRRNR